MKYFIFIMFNLLFFANRSISQSTTLEGYWKGPLKLTNRDVPLIFHFVRQPDGAYKGTFDSPDENLSGLRCSMITITSDSLHMEMEVVKSIYDGRIMNDTIVGKWKQRGAELPLTLYRITVKDAIQLKPQTPIPPFPYNTEDVQYKNTDGKINYGGTITYPKDAEKHPAIVLISGSGQQDRDCSIMGHKWFLVLADYLTRKGFVVLRVDDRGMGQTTGDVLNATDADFAIDVEQGINYMKTRKEVNIKKIGLIGHSVGGIIAPMVAARNKDVAFVVMLAGPAVGGAILNEEQNVANLRKHGLSDSTIQAFFRPFHRGLQQAAINAKDDKEFELMVRDVFMRIKEHPKSSTTEAAVMETIKTYNGLRNPWTKFYMTYKPTKDIAKLKMPVLALNGSKDTQVYAEMNLPLIKKALQKGNGLNKIMELEGLNHLFQKCTTGEIDEYGKIEETVNPEVLKIISDWLIQISK